jgi:hypothetical protein
MKKFTPQIFRNVMLVCIALLTPILAKAQYCSAYSYCYSYYYCAGFTTSGATTNISLSTPCSNPYSGSNSYNSTNRIEAVKGTSFNFTINNGPGSYMYYNIWVDWNNDNDFTDAGESVYVSGYTSYYGTQTGSVSVPSTASIGVHRLRLMGSYYGNGSPCYTYWGNGETEDYDLNVLPSCPKPLNTAATNISGNSADINWDAVTGALGYEYVLDQNVADPTTAGTFTSTNSYGAFGLNPSSGYYFHIRTKCSTTDYSLWSKISFSTIYNPCPYPGGITVSTPTASDANFSWSAVTGSQGYYYLISQLSTAPTVPGTLTTATSGSVSGLVGGANYYLYLRNICSPTSNSDWTRYQFMMPECAIPGSVLTTTITDTSADFIWGVSANSSYYEYQVDPNYAPPIGTSGFSSTTGMSAHVEHLIPQTKYYVHLRSRCFIADSSAWLLDSLQTKVGCLVPDVKVVNPNTTNPSVSWDAVPNAIAYEYLVNSNSSFPAFGNETSNLTVPPITLANDGRDYYVHVRAKCNSQFNFSKWNTQPLRSSGVNVVNVNNDKGIFAYPNPAKDMVTVKVAGSINENAVIQITDITGKLLREVKVKTAITDVNLASIPAGIYMLKYVDNDYSQVIKLTVE